MKRLLIGIALVVVVLLAVFGPYGFLKYYAGATGVIRDEVRRSVSDPIIIKITEGELRKQRERLQEAKAKIIEVDQRIGQRKKSLQRMEENLAEEQNILKRAEEMLSSDMTSFEIGSKTYSRQDLLTDVELRAANYKSLHDRIESCKRAIALLGDLKREGAHKIREGDLSLGEKESEFESLKLRLANAKVAKEIRQIRGEIEEIIPSMEFMGFEELSRRVAINEGEVAGLGTVGNIGTINWNASDDTKATLQKVRSLPGWETDSNAAPTDSTEP